MGLRSGLVRIGRHLRRGAAAYGVLSIALLLTLLASSYVRQNVEAEARTRFEETTHATKAAIDRSLEGESRRDVRRPGVVPRERSSRARRVGWLREEHRTGDPPRGAAGFGLCDVRKIWGEGGLLPRGSGRGRA